MVFAALLAPLANSANNQGLVGVVMLNDDETPMEFVVNTLQQVFGMDRDTAVNVMIKIHKNGGSVLTRAPQSEAELLVRNVMTRANTAGHPLTCKIASAEDDVPKAG